MFFSRIQATQTGMIVNVGVKVRLNLCSLILSYVGTEMTSDDQVGTVKLKLCVNLEQHFQQKGNSNMRAIKINKTFKQMEADYLQNIANQIMKPRCFLYWSGKAQIQVDSTTQPSLSLSHTAHDIRCKKGTSNRIFRRRLQN